MLQMLHHQLYERHFVIIVITNVYIMSVQSYTVFNACREGRKNRIPNVTPSTKQTLNLYRRKQEKKNNCVYQ